MAIQPRKTIRTSVLPREGADAHIERLAERNDVSTAGVIRHAIQRFLDSHEDQAELPLRLPKTLRALGER